MRYVLLVFCAWIVIAPVTVRPFQLDSSTKENKENTEPSKDKPQNPPFSTTLNIGHDSQNHSPQVTAKDEPKSVRITELPKDDALYIAYVVSTIALVFVGIAGIRMAWRTLKIIERQTKATEDAANAARDGAMATLQSVTVLAQRERAWIFVKDVSPLMGGGKVRSCEIVFENYGSTPAVLIAQSAWFGIYRWDGKPDQSWPWDDPIRHYESWKSGKPTQMGKVVIPGGKHQMRMTDKVPSNIELQGDCEDSCEYSLELYGFVVYKDVFELGQVKTFHETRFCLNYGRGSNPSGELWEMTGHAEYNSAT